MLLAQAEPGTVPADDEDQRELLIAQALDQPITLTVEDTPLRETIEQLGENTGIPIRFAQGTMSSLPYGSQTKLASAVIESQPLRAALSALLQPLALEFVAAPDAVVVQPSPPLRRLARRATWEEIGAIARLGSQPWTEELFSSLNLQFPDSLADDAEANRATLGRLAAAVGAGSAAAVLEHACQQHGWVWHPNGQVIAVVTQTRQVERQLEKRVSLHYSQISLRDALLDLAGRAGVLLRFDPGVLANLPPQTSERFSMRLENATVRQALEIIAGETGLMYLIEADGVRITDSQLGTANGAGHTAANPAAPATVSTGRSNPIVGQLTIPVADGSSYALFIRESDLPPEVAALWQARLNKAIIQIRQQLQRDQQQD